MEPDAELERLERQFQNNKMHEKRQAKQQPRDENPFKDIDAKLGLKSRMKSTEKKILTQTQKKKLLAFYLEKSGSPWFEDTIRKIIWRICLSFASILSAYWLVQAVMGKLNLAGLLLFLAVSWIAGFGILWLVSWGLLYFYLDFRMYQRKKEIEEILPDFLQLVSSNISAGMPIDRALWFAIRPKFGVLAKEMEAVAKATMTGEDLKVALQDFSEKYDSVLLHRSINLIIEGLDAGGEMADLLNKISLNFEEIKVMKKDMASSVTTYVIFISFATIVAAPMLFALATELLTIIQQLTSTLDLSSSSSFFTISPNAIKISDFKIFAYSMLFISSTLSAMLISTISKGNVKDGLKYIPIFIIATLAIYAAGSALLHLFFGGIFSAL